MGSVYLAVLFVIYLTQAANLPPGTKKCMKSEADYKGCMLKEATNALRILSTGNKELNIPIYEPLSIAKLNVPPEGGNINISQEFEDVKLYGLSHTKFTKLDLTVTDEKCHVRMESFSPKITLLGNYKITGNILVMAVHGHGKANVTMIDVEAKHDFDCELYTKEGEKYTRITKFRETLRAPKLLFDFENLVDGNEQIGKEVLRVMNENSEDTFDGMKKGWEEIFAGLYMQMTNKVFAKIPLNELIDM